LADIPPPKGRPVFHEVRQRHLPLKNSGCYFPASGPHLQAARAESDQPAAWTGFVGLRGLSGFGPFADLVAAFAFVLGSKGKVHPERTFDWRMAGSH
jgi:hypothetical protein